MGFCTSNYAYFYFKAALSFIKKPFCHAMFHRKKIKFESLNISHIFLPFWYWADELTLVAFYHHFDLYFGREWCTNMAIGNIYVKFSECKNTSSTFKTFVLLFFLVQYVNILFYQNQETWTKDTERSKFSEFLRVLIMFCMFSCDVTRSQYTKFSLWT